MSTRPLIPRRLLFDNPTFLSAKISPDGRWLSWLAPFEGVLNIWCSPSDNIKAGRPLTRTKGRPINWQEWTADGRHVLFVKDENGDEKSHVFVADPISGVTRDLTPIPGVTAMPKLWSRTVPGQIVIGLNDRDARWHDLYRVDTATGDRVLIWQNTQDFGYIGLDWTLTPRFAQSTAADGGSKWWRLDGSDVKPWLDVPYADAWTTHPQMFDASNQRLLLRSSLGRNTTAFTWLDWTSGAETVVAAHSSYDVAGWICDPITFEVDAVNIAGARQEWITVAAHLQADLAHLQAQLPGCELSVESQTDDNRRWIVLAQRAEQPATYYLFDRDQKHVSLLFSARPDLKAYRLAAMHPIQTKSRDGLDLVSYLTLPSDVIGDRPAAPLPMVLNVHGGPWARDHYGYRGDHQWLADRGYAVLSVNYRGSTGFGKAFVTASEKEHAAKMHDDLIDMVDWAVKEGVADRAKVAIWGASYGGLASFVGATFTPEVFCCSIPVVGITNLQTLLQSMPPYWAGFAEYMYRSYGDPRTEAGRALLAARSPINKVECVQKPMLIFHGANDVRCKVAESDTFVAAMQAKSIPVTYVVYPDEGHGFHKPANRIAHYAITEAFLARHLGGACEPVGEDFKGSSHDVRAGAEILADLGVA